MVILVDTREQRSLPIRGHETRVETLQVGDYWCEFSNGSRPPVLFERKSLGDLFGTMTGGYTRFKREMGAAAQQGWKLVLLCESPLAAVYDGYAHSGLPGETCVQKLFTLWVRYGLQPVFCDGRDEAAAYIVETYEALGRNWDAAAGKVRRADLFGGLQMPLVVGED